MDTGQTLKCVPELKEDEDDQKKCPGDPVIDNSQGEVGCNQPAGVGSCLQSSQQDKHRVPGHVERT